jgi:hypothetical protein
MALADPQSVTVNSAAQSLPRTSVGPNASSYTKDDGTVQLSVSHNYGKRNRRTARVTSTKIAVDPLISGVNLRVSASAYVVIDVPQAGFSAAEQKELLLSIATWLSANTGANAAKLVGGEN